eukprot:TRINITY_DN62017_c0_g1_i1.p1 TRINITY_DN62017_c0_g1~~TRINITY_DN62017_c0_g1_i1.p1  ORF type:complete len:347 (+),score=44.21 TRINITY_DN62017_c0_g1_i1:394-1434(+)
MVTIDDSAILYKTTTKRPASAQSGRSARSVNSLRTSLHSAPSSLADSFFSIDEAQESVDLGEIEEVKEAKEQAQRERAVTLAQKMIKGWIARTKYQQHRRFLTVTLGVINRRNETAAVVRIQRQARVLIAKCRLDALKEEEAYWQRVAAKKARKKRGPWAKKVPDDEAAAKLAADIQAFGSGLQAYLEFKYDEAISILEEYWNENQTDKICERLLERCRVGHEKQLEQLRIAKKSAQHVKDVMEAREKEKERERNKNRDTDTPDTANGKRTGTPQQKGKPKTAAKPNNSQPGSRATTAPSTAKREPKSRGSSRRSSSTLPPVEGAKKPPIKKGTKKGWAEPKKKAG